LAFEGEDLNELWGRAGDIDFFWVTIVFIVTIVCHIFRALRWQMLLKASGSEVSSRDSFNIMLFGYLVNQVIPRLGELARAGALKKTHKIPVTTGFGTIVFERLVDMLCLIIILLTAGIFYMEELDPLWDQLVSKVKGWVTDIMIDKPYLIYGGAAVLILLLIYSLLPTKKKEKKEGEKSKADELVERLWAGIWCFRHVNKKGLFILYSIAIWLCYFLMTYLVFFAVEETSDFTIAMGFVMFTVSSIVRNVPVQLGAAGPYHLAMSASITMVYGIANTPALLVATLIHGIQLVFFFLFGIISTLQVLLKK